MHNDRRSEAPHNGRFWNQWYTIVLLWHAVVVFLHYLFTTYFHP